MLWGGVSSSAPTPSYPHWWPGWGEGNISPHMVGGRGQDLSLAGSMHRHGRGVWGVSPSPNPLSFALRE